MTIRPITSSDAPWVEQVLITLWGSTKNVSRGKLIDVSTLPGFIAEEDGRKVGLITYHIENSECEIVTINALTPGRGIGTSLIQKVEDVAKENGCTMLVVSTTNENPKAQAFYNKRGFAVAIIRKNIIDEYRKLKPEIPAIGNDGIPLTDEIELHKSI